MKSYGDILIYGMSFGKAEYFPDEFKEKEYSKFPIVTSIDGHIIFRLEELKKRNMIKSLTISYYGKQDLLYYKELFSNTNLMDIICYIDSREIL